jgi:hypothetical protein
MIGAIGEAKKEPPPPNAKVAGAHAS